MAYPRQVRRAAGGALAVVALLALAAHAVPLTAEELTKLCADADDAAHCGRLVEGLQLQRLPNLAVRDQAALRVSLYPSGTATFTDTEAINGGRSYSLWDFMSEINAVVLYVTDGDDATFMLLQRTTMLHWVAVCLHLSPSSHTVTGTFPVMGRAKETS